MAGFELFHAICSDRLKMSYCPGSVSSDSRSMKVNCAYYRLHNRLEEHGTVEADNFHGLRIYNEDPIRRILHQAAVSSSADLRATISFSKDSVLSATLLSSDS